MRALAPVLPGGRRARASATSRSSPTRASAAASTGSTWTSRRASYGGRYGKDGLDAVDTLYANTRNNPIEDIESHFPLRVTQYELLEDRGGAGRWRGGLGSVREIEFLDDAGCSLEGDGSVWAPPGLFGGERRHAGRGAAEPRDDRRARAAVEVPVSQGGGGRPALPDLAVRRRVRRPARARPGRDSRGHRRRIREPGVGSRALRTGRRRHEEAAARSSPPRSWWRRWRSPRCLAADGSDGRAGESRQAHGRCRSSSRPGPAFDAKAKAGGKTIFVIPASSQVPFVSTIANHIKRDRARSAGVKVTIWQNQGQPSQWVQGMNAAIAQKANAIVLLAGNDPAGAPAADQGGEGEGDPDDRRAPLRREAAVGAERRRPRQHPLQPRRPADRRPGDRRHEGQGERARRDDQPGQVDRADGGRDQVASSPSTARAAS